MFSVDDFISKYKEYSDEELFEIHSNIATYCREAQDALIIVINHEGGLEKPLQRLEKKQIITNEIQRITNETQKLAVQGTDESFFKKNNYFRCFIV